ncbi:MAG: hypothetical protein E7490_04130 [Ruminococcaceae bacterium]|nr:hypothetical protein [Oscillospiraceae bacterium]
MTINAAMPAITPTGYTGTAAATDIANGTASDFSGTLGNMMNAKETVVAEAAVMQSEVDTQMTVTENGVQTAVLPEQMNLLHKELMMKNAGYAQSELIAMLLSGSNAELSELMCFSTDKLQALEGMVSDMQLSAENELMTAIEDVTEQVKETETEEAEEGFEITSAKTMVTATTMTISEDMTASEVVTETEVTAQPEAVTVPEVEGTTEVVTTSEVITATEKEAVVTEVTDRQVITEAENAEAKVPTETVQETEIHADTNAETDTDMVADTNVVAKDNKSVIKTAENDVAEVTTKTEAVKTDDAATQKPQMTKPAEEIVTTESEQVTLKPMAEEITVTEKDFTATEKDSATADEAAEEMVEFERPFAQAGKKISEKSEEALQLAKSISKTKSDSDLETEQKVTVKQELTDGGIMKNDVQFERTEGVDRESEVPVRMTVNEVYQLISERTSSATGKQTFTVVLNPESLGKITVKMVSESGKLSVEILTETDAAKQLFETRANELAENLRQSNVEIESYRVETDNDQLFNESFDGSSKNPYAERQQTESSEEDDEFERLISEMMGM